MPKYMCERHRITLVVEPGRRRFEGLSWAGSPQCALMTMIEPREGRFGECVVRRVG